MVYSLFFIFLIGTIWIQFLAYSKGIPVILKIVEGIGYNSFHPLLIMPFIIYLYLDVSKYRLISNYQKQLVDNSAKNYHVEWKWHLPKRIWGSMIHTIIIVGSFLIVILPIFQTKYKTLSVEDSQPYVVRLHTVTHPEKLKLSNIASEDYTYNYTVTSNRSIFAPKYYDVFEGFVTYTVDSNTMPRIYSKVYDLSFSFLAEPLLLDLIKDTSSFENPTKLQEVSHKQFDLLYVLEKEDYVKIYAAKDSIVTYVIHFGDPNTDTLIEELASKFNE